MNKNSISSEILTVKEVASFLKMKESWVYQRVFHKEIPHLKIGNLLRFSLVEVNEWLELKKTNIN